MKKLFGKELREQTKAALLGLAIFTFLVIAHYRNYVLHLKELAGDETQPLLSPSLRSTAGIFCCIFGVVLGWLQSRAEKHRDLWAYLVHRPMTRSRILGAKIAAGLCLYAAGAGLPLFWLLAVVATPGHIVAPFAWPMALPLTAVFLLGIVFYLAGMLTGLRQARWYGSRGFGLGLAVVALIGVFNLHEFWQALLFVAGAGGMLGLAVWGSFETGGYYRDQSGPAKLALTATCVASATVLVLAAAIFLVESLASPEPPEIPRPQFVIMTNGAVYKYTARYDTNHNSSEPDIEDLNGRTLLDDRTGLPMKGKEFNKRRCTTGWDTLAHFGAREDWYNKNRPAYLNNLRYYDPWRFDGKIRWYRNRDGRMVGYDIVTRRPTGSLQPPGNLSNASRSAAGFVLPTDHRPNDFDTGGKLFLASSSTVYRVNLEDRELKPIFTVPDDDSIGGYRETTAENDDQITFQGLAVVTRQSVYLLGFDGGTKWSIPYQPTYTAYPRINILLLAPTNRFAVEFLPDYKANEKSGWKMPITVEWLTEGEGITRNIDLPILPRVDNERFEDKLAFLLMPPVLSAGLATFLDIGVKWDPRCLIPAILCAVIGWRLGRRHSFPAAAQAGWGVFHCLFGIPGLLAFLSVQEWPARESCPHCKKPRVVDREICPHCGAEFAPPEKNGTEIFEPLAAD